MDSVDEQLTKNVNSRELLDELLQQIIAQRQDLFLELETKAEEPEEAPETEAVVTVVIEESPAVADGEDAVPPAEVRDMQIPPICTVHVM